jgi:hypothetical protein
VISFIDAINHGDVDRLAALLDDQHRLQVLNEPCLDGKEANVAAWQGYATSFDQYVIYPHVMLTDDDDVVVLGHTTGSHLDLPDEEECQLGVIWRATVQDGLLTRWQIFEDTPRRREQLGLGEAR